MLDNCKYNESMPFICTAAYRGVIGSINFMLITAAQAQVRQEIKYSTVGGIDAYNSLRAEIEEDNENERNLVEQGLAKAALAKEQLGMLACIREHLDAHLHHHNKDMVELITTGKMVANPWNVGDTIRDTLDRLIKRAPRDLEARKKLEAKALGISEEVIEASLKRQQANSAAFLMDNRERILELATSIWFDNANELDVESIFEKLPAITRLRLYVAADSGLSYARQREAERYLLRDNLESKSNIGLVDAERKVLRKEINEFLSDPKNRREIIEAEKAGAKLPVLLPIFDPAAVAKAA